MFSLKELEKEFDTKYKGRLVLFRVRPSFPFKQGIISKLVYNKNYERHRLKMYDIKENCFANFPFEIGEETRFIARGEIRSIDLQFLDENS